MNLEPPGTPTNTGEFIPVPARCPFPSLGGPDEWTANHIIAVGGAGSLGSPAAEIGNCTISAASPISTITPPTR
jgi:hypothetical protein